jgi:hypothetical protein
MINPITFQNIRDIIFKSVQYSGLLKDEAVISYNHKTDYILITQELNRPLDSEDFKLLITPEMIEKFKFLISFWWSGDSCIIFTIRNASLLLP